jgi:hypothetical protein
MLMKIFEPERDEETGEWVKLHKEELNDLYSLQNIIRFIKSRQILCLGHVAVMGENRGAYRVLVGKPEGKRPNGNTAVDGRIILRWIFRMWDLGVWTGSICLRMGTAGGHL